MTTTRRDNVCSQNGTLAIGTTVAKARTTTAATYTINGRSINKALTDDLFTLSGNSLAARQVCVFWCLLDAAGVATMTQTAVREASTSTSLTARYVAGAFDWPEPDGRTVIGAVVVNSGAAAFVPGTTSLVGVATYINAGPDYGLPINY